MAAKSDPYSELKELKEAVTELQRKNTELQRKNREQDTCIEALSKDQGIQGALTDGFDRLEKALAMKALGPIYQYGEGEAEAVAELRASLARPSFDALETNVGRNPFNTKQSGAAK